MTTVRATVERAILQHPTMRAEQIRALVLAEGIRTTVWTVRRYRWDLRQRELSLPNLRSESPKRRAIESLVYRHPRASSHQLVELATQEGVITTRRTVWAVRSKMLRRGESIERLDSGPHQPRGKKSQRVSIKSHIEAIVRMNPHASIPQLLELARRTGIQTTHRTVRNYRGRMVQRGEPIEPLSSQFQMKPIPKLTPAQEALYAEMRPFVRGVARYQVFKRPALRPHLDLILSDVERQLYSWIKNSPGKKPNLEGYLYLNTVSVVIYWAKRLLREEMGITHREVQIIFRILNGHRLGRTLEQTAEKYDIPLDEARELWEAYQAFKGRRPLPEER